MGPEPKQAAVTNLNALGIDPAAGAALFDGPPASAAQIGAAYAAACIPVVKMRIDASSAHARSLGYAGGADLDTRPERVKNVFYKAGNSGPGSIVNMFETARSDGTAKSGCSVMMAAADPGTVKQETRQYLLANTAMEADGPNSIKLENGEIAAFDGTMVSNAFMTVFSSKRVPAGDGRIADLFVITSAAIVP